MATIAGAPPGALRKPGASARETPDSVGTKSMSISPKLMKLVGAVQYQTDTLGIHNGSKRPKLSSGFFSLDCGLSANEPPYTESRTGITFSSDEYFVQGGISGRIHKDEAETLKSYETLRYFPIKKRNCYNLNVMQENRYLIRAVFLYGNYDGQETHPKFNLFIDRTLWVTVSDQDEPDKNWESMFSSVKGVILEKEIIHTAKPNTLKVFLVKTDTTTPFISALELRPLSKNIYGTKNGSLVSIYRALLRDSYEEVR
ncbi:hypothetical protein Bca101_037564 [Brassica carinata]